MSRPRLVFALLAIVALALAAPACGGGDSPEDEDPQEVLDRTFSEEDKQVDSGDLSLTLQFESTGDEAATADIEIGGPFETGEDETELPKFDIGGTVVADSADDDFDFEGGLISTGEAGFISYKGTDYEINQILFDQFKEQLERSAERQLEQQEEQQQQAEALLEAFGVDNVEQLLTNLQNEGVTDVGGTETVHISGDLNVRRSVDALKEALGSASALGALGIDQLPDPERLDELDDVKKAIEEASFDVYSGTDDDILRRLTVTLAIAPPQESGRVDFKFDFTLAGVNETQTIEAPPNPQSFDDFLAAIDVGPEELGALGDLGSGGGLGDDTTPDDSTGGGGGGGGSTVPALPGGGADAEAAQEYLQCLSQAGSAAELDACEDLAPSP